MERSSPELFVEVETATYRLSEVMQKDEKYQHVPAYFEYVSELGASLLVQATGKVFRAQRTPLDDGPGEIQTFKELLKITRSVNTIDPLDRRSLLSLEYLVSNMFIFNATEPRDAVYSLLAVARDASPLAKSTLENQDQSFLITSLFDQFLEEKPFIVDYSRPYTDVCRDFVEFVIRCKAKLDPVQALDILCRPWALESEGGTSIRLTQKPATNSKHEKKEPPWLIKRKKEAPWKKRLGTVRKDGKKFVYKWQDTWNAKKKTWEPQEVDFDKDDCGGDLDEYWKELGGKENWKEINRNKKYADGWKLPSGFDRVMKHLEDKPPNGESNGARKEQQKHETKDISLPNWIARAVSAPFSLYQHPGMHIKKTGRANADPLVGQPQDGHRNYSAAQTKEIELEFLKFRKRPKLKHYSVYVTGFILDTVDEVRDASQGGNIPKSWLDLGEWMDYKQDPPDHLWRTLIADRGRDNRNPPYYYARACKESVHKGGNTSGRVNTTALINKERNSIVAEFCRRVHAVIWNRCLFKTESGKLGLASKVQKGDKVCILYGCTVPVILRQHEKKDGDFEAENFEDQIEALKSCYVKMVERRERKARALEKLKAYDQEQWDNLVAVKDEANYVLSAERLAKEAADKVERWEKRIREAEELTRKAETLTHKADELKDKESKSRQQANDATDKSNGATRKVKEANQNDEEKLKREEAEAKDEAHEAMQKVDDLKRRAEKARQKANEAMKKAEEAREKIAEEKRNAEENQKAEENRKAEKQRPEEKQNPEEKGQIKAVEDERVQLDKVTIQSLEERKSTSADNRKSEALREKGDEKHEGSTPPPAGEADLQARTPVQPPQSTESANSIEGTRIPRESRDTTGVNGEVAGKKNGEVPDEQLFYWFNGEAYIHGMMDGEALREKFYREIPNRVFELR